MNNYCHYCSPCIHKECENCGKEICFEGLYPNYRICAYCQSCYCSVECSNHSDKRDENKHLTCKNCDILICHKKKIYKLKSHFAKNKICDKHFKKCKKCNNKILKYINQNICKKCILKDILLKIPLKGHLFMYNDVCNLILEYVENVNIYNLEKAEACEDFLLERNFLEYMKKN